MMEICAIYDKKSKTYDTPFFVKNNAQAVRGFDNLKKDAKLPYGQYPTDFELHHIGQFIEDDLTGTTRKNLKEEIYVLVHAEELPEQEQKNK